MKGLAISYPISALFGLGYWLIWFTPLIKLIGPDGSGFLISGIISLGIMSLQIILWSASGVREKTNEIIGKWQSTISIVIITLFFCWGAYILISLFFYGV
jgi:hypothetical protein